MRASRLFPALVAIGLLSAAFVATADINSSTQRYLPYSGFLELGQDPVTDAALDVAFRFYTADSGGSPLEEVVETVAVDSGRFSVNVGPISGAVFDQTNLFLAIAVGGQELGGRQRVRGTTYAIRGEVGQPFDVDELNAVGNVNAGGDLTAVGDVDVDGNLFATNANVDLLQFPNVLSKKINLWSDNYGFGIDGSTLQVYTPSSALVKFGTYSGSTFNEGPSISPNGTYASPKFSTHKPINNVAIGTDKFVDGSFTVGGGHVFIVASATGYRSSSNPQLTFYLQIDGSTVATATRYDNEGSSHKHGQLMWTGTLAAGAHTARITTSSNTATDQNDYASVMVVELPH